MDSHAEIEANIFKSLESTPKGLSSDQATKLLAKYGPNQLTQKKGISKLKIFFAQFNSFLIYILLGAIVVSLLLQEWVDAAVIFAIVVINGILGYFQEYHAERSIEALKGLIKQTARVMRDGRVISIESSKLVPGDILVVEAGDRIPADGRIISSIGLKVQEASLTGESAPVSKAPGVVAQKSPLSERTNMVFSGTIATTGKAIILVTSTGMSTELGKIAHLIADVKEEETPLQKKLDQLGKIMGVAILAICGIVFAIGVVREGAGQLFQMFLLGVSLAVAAVPEGLPAIITISLALGMQRMIRRNALIRKLPSVEVLGSTSVICTDKTGTLTRNEMTVRKIFTDGKLMDIEGVGYEPKPSLAIKNPLLLRCGAVCNNAELYEEKDAWKITGDPTEAALLVSARKAGIDYAKERDARVHEIVFDSKRKRMTVVTKEGKKKIAYVKGAPHIILPLCKKVSIGGKVKALTPKERAIILAQGDAMADEALRVLAFAYRDVTTLKDLDKSESDLIFVGLQGMIDPARPEVKPAIERCKAAGIRVIMITGDQARTAQAVGKDIGIEGRVVSGEEIEKLDLNKEVENISIYARVDPEHKMRIVSALKASGRHVVAMTGDGVNDAPALKNADLGVAMGIAGTDVAKEASDMVLTDDNFASIVGAVEEGRGIYDNIRKFVVFLMGGNVSEVLILFVALLIGFKDSAGAIAIPLFAIHLLWINLITDGIPALAIGIDPADPRIMKRKPRPAKQPIISLDLVVLISLIGITQTAAALLLFNMALPQGDVLAQTMVLSLIVIFETWMNAFIIRNYFGTPFFSNRWFFIAVSTSTLLHLIVMYTPLSTLFKIEPLALSQWAIIAGTAACFGVTLFFISLGIRHIAHRARTAHG